MDYVQAKLPDRTITDMCAKRARLTNPVLKRAGLVNGPYNALQVGCQKKTDRVYLAVLYQHYISQWCIQCTCTTRCTLSVFF